MVRDAMVSSQVVRSIAVFTLLDAAWIAINSTRYTEVLARVVGMRRFLSYGIPVASQLLAVGVTYALLWTAVAQMVQQRMTAARAAMWGFIIYGVWGFTNAAVFPGFGLTTAAIDAMWGAVLFGVAVGSSG